MSTLRTDELQTLDSTFSIAVRDLVSQGELAGTQRVVASVAALRALTVADGDFASTQGYNSIGDGGHADYYLDHTDTTSADDGGSVFVTVDGGRRKLVGGEINIKQFGARGDGVTDDTARIQAAINYAIPLGYTLDVPTGGFVLSGAGLTFTNIGAGVYGNVQTIVKKATFRGAGASSSVFLWKGTTGTAITVIVGGASYASFEGFALLQPDAIKQGVGLQITQTANVGFTDIVSTGFAKGIVTEDCFSLRFTRVVSTRNRLGLEANRNFGSYPNDYMFDSCNIVNNVAQGAIFHFPTTLNFIGGSVEGNGNGLSGAGGIVISGNPRDGRAGLCCVGTYFEGNWGDCDVIFSDVGGNGGVHSFNTCSFNRINNTTFVNNNIILLKATPARTVIKIAACAFDGFNTYVPNATRPYVLVPAPFDNNWDIIYDANYYGSALEQPSFTWTAVATGIATGPSVVAKYAIANGVCTLHIPNGLSGTSNSVNFGITGLPFKCRPAQPVDIPVIVIDNGTAIMGKVVVGTDGTISLLRDPAGNNFTNLGAKGLVTTSITYAL